MHQIKLELDDGKTFAFLFFLRRRIRILKKNTILMKEETSALPYLDRSRQTVEARSVHS